MCEFKKHVAKNIIKAGFGLFLDNIPFEDRDRKLPFTLVERWWDKTNTFHLPIGEMTLTHMDFTSITSIRWAGNTFLRI